jgi:hypothetical protein
MIFSEVERLAHYSRRWKEIANFLGDYFHLPSKKFLHCWKLYMSHAQKQPKLHDFLAKMRIKSSLVLNPNHETRKTRTRT